MSENFDSLLSKIEPEAAKTGPSDGHCSPAQASAQAAYSTAISMKRLADLFERWIYQQGGL